MRRALDLRAALKLGIRIGLDEIRADEWVALLIVDEEISKREEEQAHGRHSAGIGT